MHIVHVYDIANVASGLALGQRSLGHSATVLGRRSTYLDPPDVELPSSRNFVFDQAALWRNRALLHRADVIHIHGGIWRSHLIWFAFRARNPHAAFVVHMHGSETRPRSGAKGRHYLWLADHQFCSTPDLRRILPKAEWLPSPVAIPADIPTPHNPKPVIGHFPTLRSVKGTNRILTAFAQVGEPKTTNPEPGVTRVENSRGVLLIVENVPHVRALHVMDDCDLVVDQMNDLGIYSVVSIEAMARGKVTLSSYDAALYPERPPILALTEETAAGQFQHVLDNRDSWPDLGRLGREYAERFHTPSRVGARTVSVYERILFKL